MDYDVMKIRGTDNAPRYEVHGTSVLDMRQCRHRRTKPGTVCPICGLPKAELDDEVIKQQK